MKLRTEKDVIITEDLFDLNYQSLDYRSVESTCAMLSRVSFCFDNTASHEGCRRDYFLLQSLRVMCMWFLRTSLKVPACCLRCLDHARGEFWHLLVGSR